MSTLTTPVAAASPLSLLSVESTSLTAWLQLYGRLEAAAGCKNTFRAKGQDLSLFAGFVQEQLRSDHIDDWTPPVSEAFLRYLERDLGRKPATVNRVLATLRHCARWIHQRRPFVAGLPTASVKELVVDIPEWNGLTQANVLRMRSALEQLTATRRRKNQLPLRDRAIVLSLLVTGLRISELLRLELAQYDGKHMLDVRRKGKVRTHRVFLAKEAREALDAFIETERGREPGPLFASRRGIRLARQHVDRLLKTVAAQANARLPETERVGLSAHRLRHTFLRRITETHGVRFAMELAGHSSANYIWRYVKPSEDEKKKALEGSID